MSRNEDITKGAEGANSLICVKNCMHGVKEIRLPAPMITVKKGD